MHLASINRSHTFHFGNDEPVSDPQTRFLGVGITGRREIAAEVARIECVISVCASRLKPCLPDFRLCMVLSSTSPNALMRQTCGANQ